MVPFISRHLFVVKMQASSNSCTCPRANGERPVRVPEITQERMMQVAYVMWLTNPYAMSALNPKRIMLSLSCMPRLAMSCAICRHDTGHQTKVKTRLYAHIHTCPTTAPKEYTN
jgi:hypothetical protein